MAHLSRHPLIVIGSGAAGLMAALVASEAVPVLVVTDAAFGAASSLMAQGGLHLPFDTAESRESMVRDMLVWGGDERRVRRFVAEIAPTVELLESWGVPFNRDGGGFARRIAGGMSEPRIVGAGDHVGRELMRVLRARVGAASIDVRAHCRVDAIEPRQGGLELVVEGGERLAASTVIVACGGATWAVAAAAGHPTSNPANQNHVLHRALGRIGLEAVDEDLMQYQPFGLIESPVGQGPRPCVPESIVGFDVRLLDRDGVEVVPVLAGRLLLTEAMFAAGRDHRLLRRGEVEGIRLTLTDISPDDLAVAFPLLVRCLERLGLGGRDPLVWPFLHYQLGGFVTGDNGETAVPGLFLAGEIAGGIHGTNRLMGNGLTDSLVHGRRAGQAAVAAIG